MDFTKIDKGEDFVKQIQHVDHLKLIMPFDQQARLQIDSFIEIHRILCPIEDCPANEKFD